MKKHFLFGSIAMVSMLFTTGCQKQEIADVSITDTDVVTFTVNTQELSTRAALESGEGIHATDLYYGVYELIGTDTWALVPAISATTQDRDDDKAPSSINGYSTKVNFRLVKHKPYKIVFWAEDSDNKMCVIDWDQRTLSTRPTLANNEAYDAFWAYDDITITGTEERTIVLTRPFAQLNIGTSDLSAAKDAGFNVNSLQSAVTVSGVPTTMNILDGSVGEYDMQTSVYYETATVPTADELSFPVKNYEYLSLNYVLVGTAPSLVNIQFNYTDGDDYSYTFTSVPVKRNHRTNIYGELLTGNNDYNVEIKPGFGGEENYPYIAEEQLLNAAADGGTITLTDDIVLSKNMVVTADLVINLNGYSIKGGKEYTSGMSGVDISAITVDNNASLTINGEGTIEGSEYGIYIKKGTANINGGDIKAGTSAVQVNYGTANIDGGEFSSTKNDKRYVINCIDARWKDGDAKINITGGIFNQFNPENNEAEGPGTNFLSGDYSAMADGENFVIVSAAKVSDAAELNDVLANSNAGTIVFTDKIESIGVGFEINRSVVLNFNNNELNAGSTDNSYWYAIQAYGNNIVEINDANFTRAGIAALNGCDVVFNNGIINHKPDKTSRYIFLAGEEGTTITIKNGTFYNDRAANSFIYAYNNAIIYIEGGEFTGVASNKKIVTASGGQVIITGGTFNFDPSTWVAPGYEAIKNGSVWTVSAKI